MLSRSPWFPDPRRSAWPILVALLLVGAATGALAEQRYARGFVAPPDWEKILDERRIIHPRDKDPLPVSFDWRNVGGVTLPKDQGSCGSCWAFAAAGEMEAKILIHYGKEVDLSEQQVIACNPYGSDCGGGWTSAAYYVFMHRGGVLEGCMPYEGSNDVPCTDDQYLAFTTMTNWVSIANDVDQIKTEVYQNGPVSTLVDANGAWDDYGGGDVIDVPGSGTNHVVVIVGWDDRLGTDGAWIVKNSWGASWGMSGYCYVAYGATNIGAGTTSIQYDPPPVRVSVGAPGDGDSFYGDATTTITWQTQDQVVDTVDLYYGAQGGCQSEPIALGVPNTGEYEWLVPNVTTERASIVVLPSEGTERGYGFTTGEFEIVGHQTRYVSSGGSDTPPFDTPARAAHSLADAVLAGAGRDTILIAGGDYAEALVAINTPAHLIGGWSPDFGTHDPDAYPTRVRGVSGTLSFGPGAGDYCGVSHVTFHDCAGMITSDPVLGRHGGAILVRGAAPVIEHCRFEDNRADPGTGVGWGGAIFAIGGAPIVRDCVFTGNRGSLGGAIALVDCDGAAVRDSEFLANVTSDSTASNVGGAILVHGGQALLSGCTIADGSAGRGGGLAVTAGAMVVGEDLRISGNRATAGGGGVDGQSGGVAGGRLALVRSTVEANTVAGGSGGGIQATGLELELTAVSFLDNVAPVVGGGIYTQQLTGGAVTNCLVRGNSAGTGGGAAIIADGALPVRNTVVVGNTGGGLMAGGQATSDWNLAHGNAGGDFLTPAGAHDLNVAPVFADEAAGDFSPGLHSPLIDSGDVAVGTDWDGGAPDRGVFGGPEAPAHGPGRVEDLTGSVAAGEVSLAWQERPTAVAYAVYRDTAAAFVPGPQNLCALIDAPASGFAEVPPTGDWIYRVGAVDAAGCAGGFSEPYAMTGSGTPVGDGGLPRALAITTVAPNPFNPRTVVEFATPRAGAVRLQVFDLRGRLVRNLVDGTLAAGRHTATWRGDDAGGRAAAAGVYFVRLDDGRQARTVKVVLAK
jgi:hypothetical protein